MKLKSNEYYMLKALEQAKKAAAENEVPVGCVIVYQDKIISKAYNKRNQTNSALDHAELIAIKKACKKLNTWILEDASIYVTLEPCLMCSGAILQSRLKNLYFGAYEPKFGTAGSVMNVFEEEKFNHHVNVYGGILQDECSNILKSFFQNMRVDKKNKK